MHKHANFWQLWRRDIQICPKHCFWAVFLVVGDIFDRFWTISGPIWAPKAPFWDQKRVILRWFRTFLCCFGNFGVTLFWCRFGIIWVVLVSPCPHFEAFCIFCFGGAAHLMQGWRTAKAAQRETRRGAKKAQMSGFDQYRWKTFLFRPGTWFRHFLRKPTGERPFFPLYFSIFWAPL